MNEWTSKFYPTKLKWTLILLYIDDRFNQHILIVNIETMLSTQTLYICASLLKIFTTLQGYNSNTEFIATQGNIPHK